MDKLKKETHQQQTLYRRALVDAFRKLDPRRMARNPVMFVAEIGSVATTLLFVQALFGAGDAAPSFIGAIALWLWFTVFSANFSDALVEGRGKAQADSLRLARRETRAKKLRGDVRLTPNTRPSFTLIPSNQLHQGDVYLVEAGDILPADGEVSQGVASVDESAVTGES